MSGNCQLSPTTNTAMRTALGGWQWSSLVNVKTGEPITVSLGVYANAGETDGPQRPNQVGKALDGKGLNDWINPGAFAVPAQATFGNAHQGNVRLPRNTQVDSSLSKDFPTLRAVPPAIQVRSNQRIQPH